MFPPQLQGKVFVDEILVLQAYCLIDLGIMASDMLQRLFEHKLTAIMPVGGTDENGDYPFVLEAFITLAALGFFSVTGERYQMVIPPKLDLETVKGAFIKLAADAEAEVPAEKLVIAMPPANANWWRKRLITMDERQRVADRNTLLE